MKYVDLSVIIKKVIRTHRIYSHWTTDAIRAELAFFVRKYELFPTAEKLKKTKRGNALSAIIYRRHEKLADYRKYFNVPQMPRSNKRVEIPPKSILKIFRSFFQKTGRIPGVGDLRRLGGTSLLYSTNHNGGIKSFSRIVHGFAPYPDEWTEELLAQHLRAISLKLKKKLTMTYIQKYHLTIYLQLLSRKIKHKFGRYIKL